MRELQDVERHRAGHAVHGQLTLHGGGLPFVIEVCQLTLVGGGGVLAESKNSALRALLFISSKPKSMLSMSL